MTTFVATFGGPLSATFGHFRTPIKGVTSWHPPGCLRGSILGAILQFRTPAKPPSRRRIRRCAKSVGVQGLRVWRREPWLGVSFADLGGCLVGLV